MSSLQNQNESICDRFQDWLVDSATPSEAGSAGKHLPEAQSASVTLPGLTQPGMPQLELPDPRGAESYNALLGLAPAELQAHASACSDCRDAADDLVALRKLLRDLEPVPVAGPYFAKRVMAGIASQENSERSRIAAIWLAVPRFAARLSWVSAIALVLACGWLYERPAASPVQQQSASAFATEHLFDPPALPPNHDDVLVSLNENER